MTADTFTSTLEINIEQWPCIDLWFWLGFFCLFVVNFKTRASGPGSLPSSLPSPFTACA